MKILMTNDDGVFAVGISKLAKQLKKKHEVVIVAPGGERSASAHSITMHLPLFAKKVILPGLEDLPVYSVSGTPADCVKLGIKTLAGEGVDIVVSGINIGANLGADILYSGTVSAALEAALMGNKAIAVSLSMQEPDAITFMDDAAQCAAEIISNMDIAEDINQVLNINIPARKKEQIKGIKVIKQGIRQYDEHYELRLDPRGREYYWLAGGFVGDKSDTETDATLVSGGYVTVTPLKCDLTDGTQLDKIKCNVENLKLHF